MLANFKDRQFFVVNKVEVAGGKIHELITTQDNLGFGLAFAEERWARPHHHDEMTEVYVVCRGWVKVRVYNGKHVTLKVANDYEYCLPIKPGVSHNIIETSDDAIVAVFTFPAYNPDDVVYED